MNPKTSLCFLAAAFAAPVCSAAPIFSWETGTEGWGANSPNTVATSTTGATDGTQALAVTMPNSSMWWNAATTLNLTPEQMQAIFTNATELKLDVTYPDPGNTWGNGWLEIIIQGSNVGWTGIGGFSVPPDGAPHSLTFPLTVAQAAGMASGGWGQIILRTAYGNGGAGPITMHFDNLTNTVVADPPPATNLYWKGNVDDHWTSLNWTSDLAGTVAGGPLPTDGTAGIAFAADGATNLATVLGANQNVKSIVVTGGTAPVSIGGTHSLTVGEKGIWVEETGGGLTIDTSGGIVLGANQYWKNKSATPMLVNSVISGSGTLTKSGAGQVRLTAANTHTGGTFVEQGVLAIDDAGALGGATAGITLTGGSLDINGLNLTLGALSGTSGGSITNTAVTPATLTLDMAVDGSYACQINDTASAGPVALVKKGTATVTSSGGGSFTGPVTIDDGVFVANTWVFAAANWTSFGNCQVAGRTITVNAPGALSFTSNDVFGNAATNASLLPEIILNGSTLASTRYNLIGPVTLNGGILSQSSSDAGDYQGYQFKGNITVTGTAPSGIHSSGKANHLSSDTIFNVADVTGNADADLVVTAALTDQSGGFGKAPGGLTKNGAGTMTLDGPNSYTGTTKVLEGVLSLSSPTLSDNVGVEIAAGAVLNLTHADTDRVLELTIDSSIMPDGIYGATGSGAQFERPEITGTGFLEVFADPYYPWIASFTSLSGASATKSADPDHDGLTNIEEFALDGDPQDGAATGKVRSRIETVGAGQALVITLPVRDGAAFIGTAPAAATVVADGVDYEIGGSNDLVDFDQNVSEVVPALTGSPDLPGLNAGWTYRTFRLAGAVGGPSPRGPQGFLRAKVNGAP